MKSARKKSEVVNVNKEAIGDIKDLFGHLVTQVNMIGDYEKSLKTATSEEKKNMYKDLIVGQFDDLVTKVKLLEVDINGLKE
ncbi:MAG: hypothetical protein AB8H03_03085 [Saprospiraceae bacterium]